MHYSRVSTPAAQSYSPASAVLLNELLKGSISFVVAMSRVANASDARGVYGWWLAFRRVCKEIFSPDCWKLSIPAILYVVQNSLQFVAIDLSAARDASAAERAWFRVHEVGSGSARRVQKISEQEGLSIAAKMRAFNRYD